MKVIQEDVFQRMLPFTIVAIICPLVSEQMSDSEQALEAAAIDVEKATELLGFGTAAAFGKWR